MGKPPKIFVAKKKGRYIFAMDKCFHGVLRYKWMTGHWGHSVGLSWYPANKKKVEKNICRVNQQLKSR